MKLFGGRFQKKSNAQGSTAPSQFQLFLNSSGNVLALPSFPIRAIVDNYKSIAPLATAVTMISEAIGGLDLVLEDLKTGELVDDNGDVLKLLGKPNSDAQRTCHDLLRDMAIWRILSGNVYVRMGGPVNRPPVSLFILDPKYIIAQPGNNGWVNSYQYSPNSFGTDGEVFLRDKDRFLNQMANGELYHDRGFNPDYNSSNLQGMSPILPLWYELQQYLSASGHNLALLQNGARPSGALVLKGANGAPATLTPEQFDRLKDSLETSMAGALNSGRPLILEGGMEWVEMSQSNKDLDFLAGKMHAENQIYKKLGIPLELVNTEKSTYNNKREARQGFYEDTVLPMAEDLLDRLTQAMLPRYKMEGKFRITYNPDTIEALAPKREAYRKSVEESTVLTINEKRVLLGSKELPKADMIVTSSGTVIFDPNGPTAAEVAGATIAANQQQPDATGTDPKKKERKSDDVGEETPLPVPYENDFLAIIEDLDSPTIYAETFPVAKTAMEDLVNIFGREFIEDVSSQAIFEVTGRVDEFARSNAAELITHINRTTKKQMKDALLDAYARADSVADIAEAIVGIIPGASNSRIETIAITESTKIASFASQESMTQAGIQWKEWLTVQDGRERDTHGALDGQRVQVNQPFVTINGAEAMGPGQFGIAHEDINCRCTTVAAFEGTKEDRIKLWYKREHSRANRQALMERMAVRIFTLQKNYMEKRLGNFRLQ